MHSAKNPVAGLRGLYSNSRCFGVTNLSHHNNIRVLTEYGSETTGKSHSRFTVQLNLSDVFHAVFNRIFKRHDIAVRFVEFIQDRIKARTFSTSRGSRSQDHSVRFLYHRPHPVYV